MKRAEFGRYMLSVFSDVRSVSGQGYRYGKILKTLALLIAWAMISMLILQGAGVLAFWDAMGFGIPLLMATTIEGTQPRLVRLFPVSAKKHTVYAVATEGVYALFFCAVLSAVVPLYMLLIGLLSTLSSASDSVFLDVVSLLFGGGNLYAVGYTIAGFFLGFGGAELYRYLVNKHAKRAVLALLLFGRFVLTVGIIFLAAARSGLDDLEFGIGLLSYLPYSWLCFLFEFLFGLVLIGIAIYLGTKREIRRAQV